MVSVRELMTTAPVTIEPEETLRNAADQLTAAGVGGAPVTAGSQLMGVVTLSDILAFEADDPGVPTLRQEAPNPLDDFEGGEDEEEAQEPDTGWFFDMWEDAGADVVARMGSAESPEWDSLDEHTVSEVMTRAVFSISPDATVKEAAEMMDREHIHRLLVLQESDLVGILSAWDVVKAVARGDLRVA